MHNLAHSKQVYCLLNNFRVLSQAAAYIIILQVISYTTSHKNKSSSNITEDLSGQGHDNQTILIMLIQVSHNLTSTVIY
jgi:hypothetical protein